MRIRLRKILFKVLTFLQHLDIVPEIDVGQVLDDDVESLAADVLDHLLLVVLVVVVEDVVRAALGHHVHPVLGAGSPDDGGSQSSAIEEINSSIIRSDSPNLAFFQVPL